jgi:predicted MPP superfamily phosphohydrolase
VILFFIFAVFILGLIFTYVGWRLIISAHLYYPWNLIFWIILGVLFVLTFLPFFIRYFRLDTSFEVIMAWIGYSIMGFMSLLFLFILIRDFGWMITTAFQKIYSFSSSRFSGTESIKNTFDPERRNFIIQSINLGILGIALVSTGYGFYEARRKAAIVEVDIPLKNLPENFEGFRIVQFSDMHIGPTIKNGFVQTVVKQIKELQGDMIVFTGDLVDGSVENLRKDVAPLAELDAPFGKYFITGNHEYYSGVMPWCEKAKDLGFQVLINESRFIEKNNQKIILAGVTDLSGGNFLAEHKSDPKKAIFGINADTTKILLAHQPRSIFDASQEGYDLQLSGHTHGGQLIPWQFLTRLAQPYMEGLHKHQNTWIYVNKGTGYWGPPLRIGARSEITVLRLVKEK